MTLPKKITLAQKLLRKLQTVLINCQSTSMTVLTYGAFYGSVLGSSLLLICINDLPCLLDKLEPTMSAEDINLIYYH